MAGSPKDTSPYDVTAFLQSSSRPRRQGLPRPLRSHQTDTQFYVDECTADKTTYRRKGSSKTSTVDTDALQRIVDEVLDRFSREGSLFEVRVETRFWIDHGEFADAVILGISPTVHDLYDGLQPSSPPNESTRAYRLADEHAAVADVATSHNAVTRAYQRADEEATVAEREPFPVDPDVVERGTRSHRRLQNELADAVRASGFEPLSPSLDGPPFDLAWREGADFHIAEIKSTTAKNEEHQLRFGLGQLLRYRHALSGSGETVCATLYVERQPSDSEWSQLCQVLGITLRWHTP